MLFSTAGSVCSVHQCSLVEVWVRSLSHNLLISNTDWKTNTTTRRMKTTNKLRGGSAKISQVPAPGPAPASCHLHINNKQCRLAAGEGVN